uniref:Uncharacterized protein n=1 Tax=Salix viminalis TaxID=40686 RepID=A0A6N2K032_SALVM
MRETPESTVQHCAQYKHWLPICPWNCHHKSDL